MEPKPNRLINELSPYLLQHANNPVDWCPWNEEAFQFAKQRDVPVFLSIGYSTCHWCHVMEKESFTDLEVAKLERARAFAKRLDAGLAIIDKRRSGPNVSEVMHIIGEVEGRPASSSMT